MRNVLALAFALLAATATAQTPAPPGARLAWDHDRVNTTRFEAIFDGATQNVTNMGLPSTNEWPLPALSAGPHSVQIRACNSAGCSAYSTALQIQVIVVPGVPGNLRLAPATINPAFRAPVASPPPSGVASKTAVPAKPSEPRFE